MVKHDKTHKKPSNLATRRSRVKFSLIGFLPPGKGYAKSYLTVNIYGVITDGMNFRGRVSGDEFAEANPRGQIPVRMNFWFPPYVYFYTYACMAAYIYIYADIDISICIY